MPSAPTPAPGGGIVPTGRSRADGKLMHLAARASRAVVQLPDPLMDRLLPLLQRSTRPSTRVAAGTPISEASPGGIPTTVLAAEQRSNGTLVYLHGGSYVGGPTGPQWKWMCELQHRTKLAVAAVLYRMPPAHPFPAALEDAAAAIRGMRAAGDLVDGRWVLAGDSAGGGLALSVTHALQAAREPLPNGLLLSAPWVDLEMEHPDLLALDAREPLLGRAQLRWAAERYAAGAPLDDPRLSPINASMRGLPPVHLDVGTRDLFFPDVRRLRNAFAEAGVPVVSIEQEGDSHVYPQRVTTPEAEWAIRSQVEWLASRLSR